LQKASAVARLRQSFRWQLAAIEATGKETKVVERFVGPANSNG
jgi:hypothetical protein